MTDTESAAGEDTGKRQQIAKREWIDEKGEHTPDRSLAVGARYTYIKTGNAIERVFGEKGKPETMCAIMGWQTKVGNIVNSVINDDSYDGSADPMVDVKSWDEELGKGVWREPGSGEARGPKYDKDVLAAALHTELADKAKGDVASYRTRLDDKSYYAKVRANPAIMVRYMQEMAKQAAPAGDTLA